MKHNTMAILYATDQDSHLNDLAIHRTTASMPFGGRYRLIDFILSNMVNDELLRYFTKYEFLHTIKNVIQIRKRYQHPILIHLHDLLTGGIFGIGSFPFQ